MLSVSNEFLQAVKNKAAQDIRLEFADGSVIGKADIAATAGGLTYTEILNGDTDMTFGKAVMSELSVVLVNTDGRFTAFDFTQEFTAKVGVKLNGEYVYINLGVFRSERPEKVRGKLIEFTAHDRMSLFDRPADAFLTVLTFPVTIGEIFVQLCEYCGAEYVSAEFVNFAKNVDINPFTGTDYTCREILAWIAEAAGSYARMSREGRVELVWFSAADYTVTRKERFEMTESEFETPPIDRLEVYNSYGDQLSTSGTGDIVYGITDNPFLYIENDTQLADLQPYTDAICDRIVTLPAYQPSSFRAEWNPVVQCGDIITVVDDYDTAIAFPVFAQTVTWMGYGRVVCENTGGVTRQNKPVRQRELERLKKEMAKAAKDLSTSIESYLNSEEGVASITSAVSGKFMAAPPTYTYSTPSGVTYGFEKTADGYYTSTNAGVDSSFSYGVFTFENNTGKPQDIILRCISRGESNCDYGIISVINGSLAQSNTADSSGVLKKFNDINSETPVDVTLTIPSGKSMVSFKYRKDGSVHGEGDYFKIMPITGEYVTASEASSLIEQRVDKFGASLKLSVTNGEKSSQILLTGDGINLTGKVEFTGEVVFKNDLSTAGSTTINGANITTGKISADRIDTSSLATYKILTAMTDGNGEPFDMTVFTSNGRFMSLGASPTQEQSTDLTVWANNITFASRGAGSLSEYLVISTVDTKDAIDGIEYRYQNCIYPYNPSGSMAQWALGNDDYPFFVAYLWEALYLYDYDDEKWRGLYIRNGQIEID